MQETAAGIAFAGSIIEIACASFSPPFSLPQLVFYFTFILDRLASTLPIFLDRFATFSFTIPIVLRCLTVSKRKAAATRCVFIVLERDVQCSINYDNSNYQIQYMEILQNYTDIFLSFLRILSLFLYYYHLQNFSFSIFTSSPFRNHTFPSNLIISPIFLPSFFDPLSKSYLMKFFQIQSPFLLR